MRHKVDEETRTVVIPVHVNKQNRTEGFTIFDMNKLMV
jgi:hypothetical protein